MIRHPYTHARRQYLQKLLQLLLIIHTTDSLGHKLPHLHLHLLIQLHILHRSIGHVDPLLKSLRLPAHGLNDTGDLPEHGGLNDGAEKNQAAAPDKLKSRAGQDVVASERQYRLIDGDEELLAVGVLHELLAQVLGGLPAALVLDYNVPEAASDVDVE